MTILSVGAHMDDSEYGIGGILIQAVDAGHRVVCVVATGDYASWGSTVGREEACKQQQLELAERFGYEKRFLNYKYHQVEADGDRTRRLYHPDHRGFCLPSKQKKRTKNRQKNEKKKNKENKQKIK